MKFKDVIAVSAILLIGSYRAYAQDSSVSLDEIKAYALSTSTEVSSVDANFALQLKESLETKAVKNPELQGDFLLPGTNGNPRSDNEAKIALSQSLRISDFGARKEVSRLINKAALIDQKLSLLELTQKIRLSYVKLWALQERERLLLGSKKRIEKASITVKKSLEKGLVGKGQALTFDAESKKIESLKLGIGADIAETNSILIRLSSYPKTIKAKSIPFDSLPEREVIFEMISDPSFPPISRANLRAKLAEAQRSVARKDSYPSLTPNIFYTRNNEGFGGGLAIEIPLWYQNQGEIQKTQADIKLGNSQLDYFSGDLFKQEVSSAYKFADSTLKQSRVYRDEILPKLKEALSALEQQYLAGAASVFEILQAQRELTDAEGQWLELVVKAISARIDLSILVGNEI